MSKKNNSVTATQIIQDVLDLYEGLLIPYMKVLRDMPFPGDPDRPETDGEHAFMLAMVAITIAQKMELKLDHGKIAQYALIHDLVEAHAGDVSALNFSDEAQAIKVDREKEAFLIIKQRYTDKAPWIPELIESYESKADEESKFVYATDKQMGSYSWLSGSIVKWKETYPQADGSHYHAVVGRLRQKASIYPELLDIFDELHKDLDKKRLDYQA